MKPIVILEHLAHEHPGLLRRVLERRALPWRTIRLHEGEPVPASPEELGGLIVLGGDMNTDETDRYPHLEDERRLLAAGVAAGVPILGLCLGAQLLAEATGGKVTHGQPEIGFIPVTRTPEGCADPLLSAFIDGSPTFNGHGDSITAGPGAVILASSGQAPIQALRVGARAWGLQFHPEFDADLVATYIAASGVPAYLRANGWEPDALLAEARRHDVAHQQMGAALLDRWLDLAVDAAILHRHTTAPAGGTRGGQA